MKRILCLFLIMFFGISLYCPIKSYAADDELIKELKEALEDGVECGMDVNTNLDVPDCITVTFAGKVIDTSSGKLYLENSGIYTFTFTDGSKYAVLVGDAAPAEMATPEEQEWVSEEETKRLELEGDNEDNEDNESEEAATESKKNEKSDTKKVETTTDVVKDTNKNSKDIKEIAKNGLVSSTVRIDKVRGLRLKNKRKGKLLCAWKPTANAKNYQLQISTGKSMKKNPKLYTLSSVKREIKGLKRGKTYYVRVRAINTLYDVEGSWSKIIKIKIKK